MEAEQREMASVRSSVGRGERARGRERWLVISYWANVDGMACSHHIDDRLRHLRAAGIDVEMITSTCGPRPPNWGSRWHRVPSFSPSGYRFEVRQITRPMPRPWGRLVKTLLMLPITPLYAMEKQAINLDSTFWWWVSAGLCGLGWSAWRGFDLVYSTGGAVSAHAAAALVAGVRGLPWIAEIQDPLVYQGLGRGPAAARLVSRLERLVHARATGVVYLTERACQRAKERSGGSAPCTFIYPGAEFGAKRVAPAGSDQMQIAHVGTFGTTRNPKVLLDALARLAARRGDVRRDLRLRLLGSVDSASRRMARAFPHPEMVEVADKVSREAALGVIANSDLLLVIQNRDRVAEETIPSKTYDYLATGRPILGLVYRNRELRELLEGAGHTAVEGDDVEGIERALEASYERWRRGEATPEPFSRYTPARAVEELVAWSRKLRSSRLRRAER